MDTELVSGNESSSGRSVNSLLVGSILVLASEASQAEDPIFSVASKIICIEKEMEMEEGKRKRKKRRKLKREWK